MCQSAFKELGELRQHIDHHCQTGSCSLCNSCDGERSDHPIEELVRLKMVCDFCSHTESDIASLQVI